MRNFPLIIGHRGCKHSGIRENSCRAVEQSIREGADIIELDVVLAKDGQFIGYHPKLFRPKPLSTATGVDTFESLLKTLSSRRALYIDIKENLSQEKISTLAKLVRKYHNNQVIVGSFYEPVLRCFKQIERGWIINYHCLATNRSIKKAVAIGVNWINPIPYGITRGFVSGAIRRGLKFVPAGNENYYKQLRYAELGAYALSVFNPTLFREWLKKKM